MEQHGHDQGHGDGEGHCCQGQDHPEGRGHCGRHDHAEEASAAPAGIPQATATAEPQARPSQQGRCCRDRD